MKMAFVLHVRSTNNQPCVLCTNTRRPNPLEVNRQIRTYTHVHTLSLYTNYNGYQSAIGSDSNQQH